MDLIDYDYKYSYILYFEEKKLKGKYNKSIIETGIIKDEYLIIRRQKLKLGD